MVSIGVGVRALLIILSSPVTPATKSAMVFLMEAIVACVLLVGIRNLLKYERGTM